MDARRQAALAVSLIAGFGLVLRLALSVQELGSAGAALLSLSQFFTILTNLLVAIVMLAIASGRRVPSLVLLPVTAAILGVGLVYHAVLAQLWHPEGWVWVADHLVHTIVPAATVWWWLIFARRGEAKWSEVPACVIWPLVYCIYALMRARVTDFYPYPFLDVPTIGLTALMINVAVLVVMFLGLGAGLVGLVQILRRGA